MTRFFVILAIVFPLITAAAETLDAAALEATTVRAEQGEAVAQYALGEHFRSLGDDYRAYHWFVKAAEQGHTEAQYMASRLAHRGVEWSDDRADHAERRRLANEEKIRWLRLAAEGGLAAAQAQYANEFRLGREVDFSLEEAVHWYRKAAEQGLRYAQVEMARIHEAGAGVEQDYAEALRWYREAGAAYEIGQYYEHGLSVEQDYEEALRWYWEAAGLNPDGSHPDGTAGEDALRAGPHRSKSAVLALARFYEKGWAVPANPDLAMDIYRVLAEGNDREAMRQLARIYLEGIIVPRDARKSAEWAFQSLRGDDESLFDMMGFMISPYYQSEEITELMVKTFQLAVADGEAWAQWFLSIHYRSGTGGLEQDTDAVVRLLEGAAEQGHPLAASALGQRYLEGDGVEQDDEKAALLFQTALETVAIRRESSRQHSKRWEDMSELWDFVPAIRWFRERGIPEGDLFSMYGLAILQGPFATRGLADLVEVYQWVFIAEARGFPVSDRVMKQLVEQETPDLMEEGRRRAEAWLEANPE